ncbi:MAG: hypothetical protein B7X60_01110 [Polynucleobacter sp. 39-45-136]|jgi:hypothetical protein|nr:MAG: hypothetical protein B7X60_01110 [Polynucleobacter sp. 39-45-136]
MTQDQSELTTQLEAELLAACEKVEHYLRRHNLATRALIVEKGAVKAATELVMHPKIQDGFVDLLLIGKSYLTVEYIVCKKRYISLFSKEVRDKAWEKIGFSALTPKRYFKKKPIILSRFR